MPKNVIRTAVVLALVLIAGVIVAGSCSGGGGGSSVSSVCSAYCSQLEECDPGNFNDYYDDKAECKDDCVDENENYWQDYEPSECKGEAMDLAICGYGLSCDDLDNMDYGACEGESNDLDDCLENSGFDTGCGEDDVTACADDYTACYEDCDSTSSTYTDCLYECIDWYCTCLEDIGCDMSGYGCEDYA